MNKKTKRASKKAVLVLEHQHLICLNFQIGRHLERAQLDVFRQIFKREPAGGFVTEPYSLRSSSSGPGFWKNAIQGRILSSEIWKVSWEGCAFRTASRLSSSSSGTSR